MLHILVGNQMDPGQEANPDLWWKKLELSKQGRKKNRKGNLFKLWLQKTISTKSFFSFKDLLKTFDAFLEPGGDWEVGQAR